MNGNKSATLETNEGTNFATVPRRKVRFSGVAAIAFGISCYVIFAALYFSKPNKPIITFGQLHFTMDAFLEILFTFLSLPSFFLAYRCLFGRYLWIIVCPWSDFRTFHCLWICLNSHFMSCVLLPSLQIGMSVR